MPTPSWYDSGQAIDGTVPGMNWSDFSSNFTLPTDDTVAGTHANINGLGLVGALRSQNAGTVLGGDGVGLGVGDGPKYGDFQQYAQDLPDGTQNQFSQGPNGEVLSKNVTKDDDSWWDTTGIPIVASLAAGGAIGLAGGFAGAGASAATAGSGELGGLSTADALGEFGGSAALDDTGATLGAGIDGGNLGIGLGNGAGTTGTDAATVGSSASDPGFLQSMQNLAQQYGFGNGPIGSVQNIINGTGQLGDYLSTASSANTLGGIGNDLTSGGNSAIGDAGVSVGPSGSGASGNGLSFSDAASGAGDYNGGLSGASNSPTLGGYFSQLQNDPLGTLGQLNSGLRSTTGLSGLQLLGSLYSGISGSNSANASKNTLNTLNGLFSPTGAYAQQLQQTLARRDAAAGRQSQYGPRQVELEADLAKIQASTLNSSNYNQLSQQAANPYAQGLNTALGFLGQNQAQDSGAAMPTNILNNLLKYYGGGSS